MKYMPLCIMLLLLGCSHIRDVHSASISIFIEIRGDGEIYDRELMKEYEKELRGYNKTSWFIRLFLREPIKPKPVRVGNERLKIAITDDGKILDSQDILSGNNEYKLTGSGTNINIVIMGPDSVYTLHRVVDKSVKLHAQIIPGVIVHKIGDG